MTTYTHSLTFGDSDVIALREAIDRYIETCKEELADGAKAPYWAHLRSLEGIRARLCDNSIMASTSSPCWPDISSTEDRED